MMSHANGRASGIFTPPTGTPGPGLDALVAEVHALRELLNTVMERIAVPAVHLEVHRVTIRMAAPIPAPRETPPHPPAAEWPKPTATGSKHTSDIPVEMLGEGEGALRQERASEKPPARKISPNDDFSVVNFYDSARFQFTPPQSRAIRLLCEETERGFPEVKKERLVAAAGSEGKRIQDVFKSCPGAWGILITDKGCRKGFCRFGEDPQKRDCPGTALAASPLHASERSGESSPCSGSARSGAKMFHDPA